MRPVTALLAIPAVLVAALGLLAAGEGALAGRSAADPVATPAISAPADVLVGKRTDISTCQ